MFYKQTVDNIKVVILSLDGGILDLNRLRFNYLKKICKIHNYDITKEEFEKCEDDFSKEKIIELFGNQEEFYKELGWFE